MLRSLMLLHLTVMQFCMSRVPCSGLWSSTCGAASVPQASQLLVTLFSLQLADIYLSICFRFQTFRREHDRFWILAAHPDINLLAAGHDG